MPFYKEIQVGIYSNQELKVIGMLHQIGHYIQSNNEYDNIFMKQLGAWKEAYKLIKQYNIQITDEMIEYFINCLNSYNKEQYYE